MAKENKAGHKEGGAGKKRKEPQHPEHKDKEHREEGKEHGEEHKHAHEERKPKEEHKEAQHEEHKPEEKYEEAHHERPPEEHREERKQEEGHVEHREERAREEENGAAQESQIASGEKQEERHAPKEAGPEAEAVHEEEGRNVPQEAKAGGAYENEEDEERSIPWKSIAAIAIILIVVAAAALLLSQSMAPPPVYPTPLISVSSTVIDAGQAVVFNAMANGNYTPVSYDFVIVSAATGNALANVINANSMAYNSLAYTTNAAEAGNVLLGRVTVAYARGKAVSNESPGVTVNPRILAANVVTTASSISNGQAVSLTAGWSGGTPTYTLRWFVGQSASCAQDAVTLLHRHRLVQHPRHGRVSGDRDNGPDGKEHGRGNAGLQLDLAAAKHGIRDLLGALRARRVGDGHSWRTVAHAIPSRRGAVRGVALPANEPRFQEEPPHLVHHHDNRRGGRPGRGDSGQAAAHADSEPRRVRDRGQRAEHILLKDRSGLPLRKG